MSDNWEDIITVGQHFAGEEGGEMSHYYNILYIKACGEIDSDIPMEPENRQVFRLMVLSRLFKTLVTGMAIAMQEGNDW